MGHRRPPYRLTINLILALVILYFADINQLCTGGSCVPDTGGAVTGSFVVWIQKTHSTVHTYWRRFKLTIRDVAYRSMKPSSCTVTIVLIDATWKVYSSRVGTYAAMETWIREAIVNVNITVSTFRP
jgi:hypothetical protein